MSDMTKNKESEFDLCITDIQSSADITDSIDDFELKESKSTSHTWITVNGNRSGLLQMRKKPRNKVYSIKIIDDEKNEIFRMMEIADDIVNGKPVFLK